VATIYLISGLGADARVFQKLDLEGYKTKTIEWIAPLKGESLKDYAFRISGQIETNKPILVGVSFGGMLAVEISKIIDCQKVILISSAKRKHEIPLLYRLFGRLRLHRLIPISILKHANVLTYWLFGMKTKIEKDLLKSILKDTDPVFLKWAMNAIIQWENQEIPEALVHLHGDADRILPVWNIRRADFIISGGGHLMIYSKAEEINQLLKKQINDL
jgi:pimeloyl-ACP methyl ester carboxylesterase